MGLTVEPDPAHPHGGHARLVLTGIAGLAPGAEVLVGVLDPYSGKHLGAQGFQRDPVAFGPYRVAGTVGRGVVTLGPEVVNQIAEYAALRISVSDPATGAPRVAAEVRWPDSVFPATGAARIGGLVTPGRPPGAAPPPPDPTPDPAPADADPGPVRAPLRAPVRAAAPRRARWPWALGAAVVAGLVAAAVYWAAGLVDVDRPLVEPETTAAAPAAPETDREPAPEPAAEPVPDTCGAGALADLSSGPFDAVMDRLAACGPAISADRAFALVESAAVAGEARALYLFGVLYDADTLDAGLETEIGVQLTDSPEIAADYYARAAAAGWAEAAVRLAAVCARLATRDDTPAQVALRDHCGGATP
jgi:hypothetical protein